MLTYMNRVLISVAMVIVMCLSCAAHAMSFDQERKIAREIVTRLDAQGLLIYDREVTWPLKMVTDKLADHIKDPMYTFTLHVVKDRSVNAFAVPDGHIFVNMGTILFARDLDELAAVIGHEMGHVQLRHIPQTIEEQKTVTAATIAGVILGTILSSKNPEAGAALIYSSLGGGENIKLAYSRRHEHASDEFGNRLMKDSGFDPAAMNRFLVRLGTFSGGSDIPEYLLTHPYITNRLSDRSSDTQKPSPDPRYWTLYAGVTGLLLSESEAMQRSEGIPDPYRRLALGMLETRKGRHEKALELLSGVDLPEAYAYRGLNLFMLGKKDEAYPYLKKFGMSARPQIALAEIMKERGEFDQAVDILRPYQKHNAQVDYELGILYEKSSRQVFSHVSFARYFFRTNKYQAALYHTDKALEGKKDLEQDVVDELKGMKEYIQKMEQY